MDNKAFKWSPEFAYALGLLVTDGNLSKDGRHFNFTSKDFELVQVFRRCLRLDNKIGTKTSGYSNHKGTYYYVQFGNVRLYKELLRIGLMPNKSKRIGEMDIPEPYMPDFLRGHLDGDGCVRVYPDPVYPNSLRLYLKFISASMAHIKWLQERITQLWGIKGYVQPSGGGTYELIYAKHSALLLLPRLYYNKFVPCLERKHKLVKPFL